MGKKLLRGTFFYFVCLETVLKSAASVTRPFSLVLRLLPLNTKRKSHSPQCNVELDSHELIVAAARCCF